MQLSGGYPQDHFQRHPLPPLFGLAFDFFVHLMSGWRNIAKRVSSPSMKIKLSFYTSIDFAVSFLTSTIASVHVRMSWRHTNRGQSKLLHVSNNKRLCWNMWYVDTRITKGFVIYASLAGTDSLYIVTVHSFHQFGGEIWCWSRSSPLRHASEEVISLPFKSQTALLLIVTIF